MLLKDLKLLVQVIYLILKVVTIILESEKVRKEKEGFEKGGQEEYRGAGACCGRPSPERVQRDRGYRATR